LPEFSTQDSHEILDAIHHSFYCADISCHCRASAATVSRPSEETITVHAPDQNAQTVTLRNGELRRVRTGWNIPSTRVEFEFQNPGSLHFDNLAYAQP